MDSASVTDSSVLSVGELSRMARLALERMLPLCWIRGEVSNLSQPVSGHWYFTLKDRSASVRCVMFRNRNQFVSQPLRDGVSIDVRAQATLYEPRGDFQLNVEALRRAGQGELHEAFLALKQKLYAEGLFADTRKRPIPAAPARIGLVTSIQAAALHDVLTTLRRRWPLAAVELYPCMVQGREAPDTIRSALQQANQRQSCDVLLLIRGGGSLEDLHAYNDEALARAIAASAIPVVTGIGHETDFTIADFVADLRAPTPTGAAEIVTPERSERLAQIGSMQATLRRQLRSLFMRQWQGLDEVQKRLRHPGTRLAMQAQALRQQLDKLAVAHLRSMQSATKRHHALAMRLTLARPRPGDDTQRIDRLRQRLGQLNASRQGLLQQRLQRLDQALHLLCPTRVLERGYSIVRTLDGRVVHAADSVALAQRLDVELAQGRLQVVVQAASTK